MTLFRDAQHRGFTLLEVLISLLVLAIGALGMVAFAITSMKGNRTAEALTTSTTLSHQVLEMLRTLDFADLGSDTLASCLDANGKINNGSSAGVCVEAPLNHRGRSQAEGGGTAPYRFTRYTMVCTDSNTMTDGYAGDDCDIPTANLSSGPVPDELVCNDGGETTNTDEKEIKVMTTWRDRTGRCHTYSSRAIVADM